MRVNRHVFDSISQYMYDCMHIALEYLQIVFVYLLYLCVFVVLMCVLLFLL